MRAVVDDFLGALVTNEVASTLVDDLDDAGVLDAIGEGVGVVRVQGTPPVGCCLDGSRLF